MAKITSPLLSVNVSGTLAGFFTIERRNGKDYCYEKKRGRLDRSKILAGFGHLPLGLALYGYSDVITSANFSPEQGARRLFFKQGFAQYRLLTPQQKQALMKEADRLAISIPQLWMRKWLLTWGS